MVTIEEFQNMLNRHDWYYDMADDSRSYRMGEQSYRNIRNTLESFKGTPDFNEALRLYETTALRYSIR